MRPLILLDAAPFCYGPISTLLAVVDHLLEEDLELVLLASGTAAEFASAYDGRCRLVPCDTEDLDALQQVAPLFHRCDVFVSNTNPVSARYAATMGCAVAYIDTLFWMWDEIDPAVAGASLYVAQTFDGIEANLERLGDAIPNFEQVGPLIARPQPERGGPQASTCVVSFGGMESSLTVPGVTNRYPWVMTRLLLDAFASEATPSFDRILFCGRERVMAMLRAEFVAPGVSFQFIPHRPFLQELARCDYYLLSPGLTGAYEAMLLSVPRLLLLPQNYSQQLQAETFLRQPGWPFVGHEWTHLYPEASFPRYLPEPEAVAQVNAVIRRFEDDAEAQARYVEHLVEALGSVPAATQRPPCEPGAEQVATRILALAQHHAGPTHPAMAAL